MAGCMGGYGGTRMKVLLDKKRLQVSTFKEYVAMYEGMEAPVFFEKISSRWEVPYNTHSFHVMTGFAVKSSQWPGQCRLVNSISSLSSPGFWIRALPSTHVVALVLAS